MTLSIRALAPTFAAEVRGIDLRQPLRRTDIEDIYQAFIDHGVLVLPGQAITIEQQLDFARTFGDLWEVPSFNHAGRRIGNPAIDDVSNIDKDGDLSGADSEKVMFQLGNQLWHSDLSSNPVPAQASMLHALEVVPEGGETEFADMHAAYDALSPQRQAALEGLIAEHSLAHSRLKGGYMGQKLEQLRTLMPPSLHPVIRIHPETGRKGLYVGAHAARILGMDDEAGARLIDDLIAAATQPPFVYSHRWAVHDLVIWDNRRALHRGRPYDADRFRRVMHRATVSDLAPTVIDGKIAPPTVRRQSPRLAPAMA